MTRLDVNKIVMKAAREAAEKRLEELQASGQLLDPEKIDPDNPESSPTPQIKKMFSSFPSSEGYYGKIWKVKPDGAWEVKDYKIEAPESVPDLELEISRIVKEKGWGAGRYVVQVHKVGEKGFKTSQWITIGDPTPEEIAQEPTKPTIPKNPMMEGLDVVDKGLSIVERLKPAPVDIAAIMQQTREAMKEGRTMSGGNGPDNQLSAVLQIIEKFLPQLIRPQVDIDTIIEKIVTRLQPQQNPIEIMAKFKETLGFKFAHEVKEPRESELASVEKVGNIINAIRPLINPEAEPSSWISTLVSKASEFIGPLITSFKDFAEAKKLEMQLRTQNISGQPALVEKQPVASLPAPVHPFVTRILKAVNENDELYFNMMRQQVSRLYGRHVIDGLVSGEFTSDFVIETFHDELGLPVAPNLKPYFEKFIQWLRDSAVKTIPGIRGIELVGRCKSCNQEYLFDSLDKWEKDSKKCEDCGGELELVKTEGEA